ncbi:MAG: glycosyltransferase family 1 protein [Candidatus Dormibacteria bacterium]|jgi:alpha-1,3-rhamnosyl/mannosyltransferase
MDGRPLQGASSVRGIGSYERGLLSGFVELADPPHVSLLLSAHAEPPAEATSAVLPSARRIPVIHPTLQPIADTLFVARALRGARADLYHAIEFGQPVRTRLPVVVTVHDLIPFVMPRDYPWVRRARVLGLRLLRHADAVIAVSDATRRDILRFTRTDPARITVIPEGIGPAFRPATADAVAQLRAKLGLDGPFLLAVGTFDPRKRIALLADVMRRVRLEHDVALVIAGDQGTFMESVTAELDRAGIAQHTRVIGHVTSDDLVALYTGAEAFVFTSAYEGFGLPPLEAMACGTPAVVFDNSSIAEVSGGAADVVRDGDTAAMGAAINRLLDDPAEHERRRATGRTWAATFTWHRAAEMTVEVYRSVLGR